MKKIIVGLLLLVSCVVSAQKTEVISGRFENLKDVSELNLVFDYQGLNVDGHVTEEAFFADRLRNETDRAIEEGRNNGEKQFESFKKEWLSDKKGKYEPKFIESFKKRFKGEVKADKKLASAKYTATINTTYIHGGCPACGNPSDSSKMNANITVTENANPGNVLLVYKFTMEKRVPTKGWSIGFDAWAGERISETYAKLAKEFAGDLKKSRN